MDDKPDSLRTVWDLSRSTRTIIDPLTQSRTTYHSGARTLQAWRDPSGGCKYPPGAPTETVLGVAVRRYEKHWTAGTRQIDEQGWVSPSLGCYALKRSYDVFESGQKIGTTTNDVISISFGDPSAELFEVPANYTERKPSEQMALRAEKRGKPPPAWMEQGHLKVDDVYDSQHRP